MNRSEALAAGLKQYDAAPRKQISKEAIQSRSRARGTEKAVLGDGRHEYLRVEAAALLDSFLAVPDFLARCEERIQAVRAGS